MSLGTALSFMMQTSGFGLLEGQNLGQSTSLLLELELWD
jgi:hypothetical protein